MDVEFGYFFVSFGLRGKYETHLGGLMGYHGGLLIRDKGLLVFVGTCSSIEVSTALECTVESYEQEVRLQHNQIPLSRLLLLM